MFSYNISDMFAFLQHSSDKDRFFKGVLSKDEAVDLIIVDVPEGLSVPTVSTPPSSVPAWNKFSEEWLLAIFDFAETYLHDGGGLLVIYPFCRQIKSHLLGNCKSFGFQSKKDWWGMNRLHLTSPSDPLSTVRYFLYHCRFSQACLVS